MMINKISVSSIAKLLAIMSICFLTACASLQAPENPFVGEWDLTMNSPMGNSQSKLTVLPDLTGTLSSAQLGEIEIKDTKVEGNTATFSITISAMGQQLAATFEGVIDGDNLKGTLNTDFGPFALAGMRIASNN